MRRPKKETVDMVGDDIENNNVAVIENVEDEPVEVLTVSEEASKDNDEGDAGNSLKKRLWNSCQII